MGTARTTAPPGKKAEAELIDFRKLEGSLTNKEIAVHLEISPEHFRSVLNSIGKAVEGYSGKEEEFADVKMRLDEMMNTFDIRIAAMYVYGAYPSLPISRQVSVAYGLSKEEKGDGKRLAEALGPLVTSRGSEIRSLSRVE